MKALRKDYKAVKVKGMFCTRACNQVVTCAFWRWRSPCPSWAYPKCSNHPKGAIVWVKKTAGKKP